MTEPIKAPPAQSQRFTETKRKKLAKEARRLAMECVEGTAPFMDVGHFWNSWTRTRCALGWCSYRAGVEPDKELWIHDRWSAGADLVIAANDSAEDGDRHAAVIFPLLAFADDLESGLIEDAAEPHK